jgi:hypothetical protein
MAHVVAVDGLRHLHLDRDDAAVPQRARRRTVGSHSPRPESASGRTRRMTMRPAPAWRCWAEDADPVSRNGPAPSSTARRTRSHAPSSRWYSSTRIGGSPSVSRSMSASRRAICVGSSSRWAVFARRSAVRVFPTALGPSREIALMEGSSSSRSSSMTRRMYRVSTGGVERRQERQSPDFGLPASHTSDDLLPVRPGGRVRSQRARPAGARHPGYSLARRRRRCSSRSARAPSRAEATIT